MIDLYTFQLLMPEIVLVLAALTIFMVGAFASSRSMETGLGVIGLLVAGIALYRQDTALAMFSDGITERSGPLVVDAFGHTARWGILLIGMLLVVLVGGRSGARQHAEYLGSLLLSVAGLMLVAASNELVLLFVGLELVSIPTYVLLYLGRSDAQGQESTAKYFFLSILSSSLLLYGFSFLYGSAGSTSLADLHIVLRDAVLGTDEAGTAGIFSVARLGLLLTFAGLGFRVTAVPFHFYAADVYQGTSHPNASFLSTLPKIAGLLVLIRLVAATSPGLEALGWKLSIVLAALTMTVGNLLALWQDDLRRMFAYSSVAHGGYMLIGLAVAFATSGSVTDPDAMNGTGTIIFYVLVYALATIGTFAAFSYLGSRGKSIDAVDDLAGLSRTHVVSALAIAIFMFSLTGIPPLAGFWGKFALFLAALDVDSAGGLTGELRPWFVGLAVLGVLNAAISAAYYLRIVGVMYFRPPLATARAEGGMAAYGVMLACALAVVGAGLRPGGLIDSSNRAGRSVMQDRDLLPAVSQETGAAANAISTVATAQ